MKLHLASGNPYKAQEFAALLADVDLPWNIVSARDSGGMPAVVEDTGTFAGNARKKARALQAQLPAGSWVLADDSGLCVAALNGAPGVESAYFAGLEGDGAANLRKLTEAMRHVPAGQRQAWFTCVLVILDAQGQEYLFEGRCEGTLRESPAGGLGFGYDPLFVPEGQTLTFAEMADRKKSGLSHRGLAWSQVAEWLRARSPV